MAKRYDALTADHKTFIQAQHVFFVGTAAPSGTVNISPKGMDSLRIMNEHRIVWLNTTGSGNESASHVQIDPRMTLMFCAFQGAPLILRLYGRARVYHQADRAWLDLLSHFPSLPGARQIFVLDIELVQTSCGMSVPLLEFQGEREQLNRWALAKGQAGLHDYWRQKNQVSLDGFPSHILQKSALDVNS